jgi:hypothetical protein
MLYKVIGSVITCVHPFDAKTIRMLVKSDKIYIEFGFTACVAGSMLYTSFDDDTLLYSEF